VLRGISLEAGGHFNDRMWHAFWDFVFAASNLLLAVLLGAAMGNIVRGVPIDAKGDFPMAFFTDFGVRGNVGLLDWYTVSVSGVCLVMTTAHGATYLSLKTDGPVHDRCFAIARRLWTIMPVLFVVVLIETWYVRPELLPGMIQKPVAWLGIACFVTGAAALFASLRLRFDFGAFMGSSMLIVGLLATGAVAIFPVILYSTFGPENSLTAYNTATSLHGLKLAIAWWPLAMALSFTYFGLIARHYSGKVKLTHERQADSPDN
jgi:cytochrome bd ubiquinol oxidase subunit II